jgi:hypothetical protein
LGVPFYAWRAEIVTEEVVYYKNGKKDFDILGKIPVRNFRFTS